MVATLRIAPAIVPNSALSSATLMAAKAAPSPWDASPHMVLSPDRFPLLPSRLALLILMDAARPVRDTSSSASRSKALCLASLAARWAAAYPTYWPVVGGCPLPLELPSVDGALDRGEIPVETPTDSFTDPDGGSAGSPRMESETSPLVDASDGALERGPLDMALDVLDLDLATSSSASFFFGRRVLCLPWRLSLALRGPGLDVRRRASLSS